VSADEQYVLVGVARPREPWTSDLARWATSGAAPIEFVKCMTTDEARAVLGSGRRVSALLLGARGPGIDRDLIATAASLGTPTLVVTDGSVQRDWDALGCAAVLDHRLSLQSLLERLDRHAVAVDRSRRPGRIQIGPARSGAAGRTIAVVGAGGVGTTTVAMALAQALGHDGDAVVLVDGARRGDLAMYHHLGDVIPGMPELVEAHRSDRLDPAEVRALTFEVASRGYSVLLGRRRVADWVTLRRRSVDAALDALARSFATVVIDIDPDMDGQADTGSPDVEDRHAVTLAALDTADLVVAVGRAGLHGVHALTALIDDVLCAGTPRHRLLPVVVDAARSPASRATLAASITRLVGDAGMPADEPLQPSLQLRRVRGMDDLHDRVALFPASLCRPLGRAVQHLLDELGPRPRHDADPDRIRPGELATAADPGSRPRSDVA